MLNNNLTEYTDDDIIRIADVEYTIHPEAKLIDFYKLFLQSCFGQGHFVTDIQKARTLLYDELENMSQDYYPWVQDISNGKGFYRVSLSVIRDNIISISDFIDQFLNAPSFSINWEAWSKQWHYIYQLLSDHKTYTFNNSEILMCDDILRLNRIPSHSDLFRLTYSPHYRVMLIDRHNPLLK
jgi:hypothetical protein